MMPTPGAMPGVRMSEACSVHVLDAIAMPAIPVAGSTAMIEKVCQYGASSSAAARTPGPIALRTTARESRIERRSMGGRVYQVGGVRVPGVGCLVLGAGARCRVLGAGCWCLVRQRDDAIVRTVALERAASVRSRK